MISPSITYILLGCGCGLPLVRPLAMALGHEVFPFHFHLHTLTPMDLSVDIGNSTTPWRLEAPNSIDYLATPTKLGNTFTRLG